MTTPFLLNRCWLTDGRLGTASPKVFEDLYAIAGQVPAFDIDYTQRTITDRVSGIVAVFTRPSSVKLLWNGTQLQSYPADVPGFELRNGVWEYSHEPAATNLYTNNRTFTASSGHTLQTSGGQRLDGAGTLVKLVPGNGQDPSASSNAGMLAGSTVSLANDTQYTQSIYAKAAELNQVRIRSNASGQIYTFTLGSPPPAPTGTITAATSELIGDGWYRLSWTFLSTSTAPGNRTDHWSIRAAVTGDGTSGFFVDLGQVELGPIATSPIITAGAAVTRTADTMTISGAPFASFYNQPSFTWYAEYAPNYTSSATVPLGATPHVMQVDTAASVSNNYAIRGAVSEISQFFIARNVTDGLALDAVNAGYLSAGQVRRVVYSITDATRIFAATGAATGTVANNRSANMVAHDRLTIGVGTGGAGALQLNGGLRRLVGFRSAVNTATATAMVA